MPQVRRSKATNGKVKAMQWQGQSYAMRGSKATNEKERTCVAPSLLFRSVRLLLDFQFFPNGWADGIFVQEDVGGVQGDVVFRHIPNAVIVARVAP